MRGFTMKIAVAGKGGVGKTTLCALLASQWASAGRKIIAVDADPFPTLALALGFSDAGRIVPMSEMAALVEERTGAKPGAVGQFFKLNPRVDDLPERLSVEHDGIRLLVMGGLKSGGAGCACPENVLVRSLIEHLVIERNETVIVDMPAGVEHLTRGTARAVDVMVAVVEPSESGISAVRAVLKLSAELGIARRGVVVNKVWDAQETQAVAAEFKDVPMIGSLPFMPDFRKSPRVADLLLQVPALKDPVAAICDAIEALVAGGPSAIQKETERGHDNQRH
jgi:CO dehydrogenase maturation factor